MEGQGGGPVPGSGQLPAGDAQRVIRAVPRQECLRGVGAAAGGGEAGEPGPLHRDQGHHGPDHRGWSLHPRD